MGWWRAMIFWPYSAGRKRQSACECERTSNITLSHALNLINGRHCRRGGKRYRTTALRKLVEVEKRTIGKWSRNFITAS